MADYYSLITQAVAGLDPDAPDESRQAIYERASAALLAKLRTVEPPFTEADITRERLALEEAVRRVEHEAAQRGRATRSLYEITEEPPMIVTGGATGRLSGIWRWKSRLPSPSKTHK
jgi:hypothetical protein